MESRENYGTGYIFYRCELFPYNTIPTTSSPKAWVKCLGNGTPSAEQSLESVVLTSTRKVAS